MDIGYSALMAVKSTRLTRKQPRRRTTRKHRRIFAAFWQFTRRWWQGIRVVARAVMAAPPVVRAVVIATVLVLLWLGLNWAFHAFHKPSEIFFPLDQSLTKRPVQTWKEYETPFREHATATITPELLGALAQVEGGGNPVARTYWRWEWTWNPLEWYRPASSAVGMYQITDGTFEEAKRYCIHDHEVIEDGLWHDLHSCWFNRLYTRVIPSHAIELTAALLDRQVTQILGQRKKVPLDKKQDLAAVIHLCGAGAGRAYAARGLRLTPNQQCGDHKVKDYLARINALKHRFANPAIRDNTIRQAR